MAWVSQMQVPSSKARLAVSANTDSRRFYVGNTRVTAPNMKRLSSFEMSTIDMDIEGLTVPELKEQLRERGLKVCL